MNNLNYLKQLQPLNEDKKYNPNELETWINSAIILYPTYLQFSHDVGEVWNIDNCFDTTKIYETFEINWYGITLTSFEKYIQK